MKIGIESNILRHALANCYFINGTAYAGKSTMVRLLAERFGGIQCRENYHDVLMEVCEPDRQPNICYFKTMSGWREFVSRTPEQYSAWIDGTSLECAELELVLLLRLAAEGKPVFVDTNIPPDWLREIAAPDHVAIMLCPNAMSVERFFDRPDPEKQFLLGQIMSTPDPEATRRNFLACIDLINRKAYREFSSCGLYTFVRDGSRTIEETLDVIAGHFGLL